MQRRVSACLVLVLSFLILACARSAPEHGGNGIEVHFSPKAGCTEAVVKGLIGATNTVLVQAYSFTSAPIAKALVDAHKRGVKVQAILERASARRSIHPQRSFITQASPSSSTPSMPSRTTRSPDTQSTRRIVLSAAGAGLRFVGALVMVWGIWPRATVRSDGWEAWFMAIFE